LGYLAISGAKYDVIFLLSDPHFLQGRRNVARTSRSFQDLTRDRQTAGDGRGDRNRRLSHCKFASLKIQEKGEVSETKRWMIREVGEEREREREREREQLEAPGEACFCRTFLR